MRRTKKTSFWRGIFIIPAILISLFFTLEIIQVGNKSLGLAQQAGITPQIMTALVFNSGTSLKATNGRTNILVMGMGGGAHDGADLTDTMMVISLDQMTRKIAFISIPRDLWQPSVGDKINSVYHYGEQEKKGEGIVLAKQAAREVIGLPIHYSLTIDFSGFKNLIDTVGGIDITVPETFTDYEYPIAGKEDDLCNGDLTLACRYETVTFTAGQEHMDGDRALKYVRSRHSLGPEGSDFARSRRQQEVLVALKDRLMNPSLWMSTSRAKVLYKSIDDATDTDLTIGELMIIGRLVMNTKSDTVRKISFETLLDTPPAYYYGGAYVLVPQTNYEEIHTYILEQLSN